jgi:ABC-2 type transport system ATP-binding protein
MSSHLLADLERVCDHLIILASGETQLCDDIDHALKSHKLLVGAHADSIESDSYTIIQQTDTSKETTLLVRLKDSTFHNPHWHVRDVDIEEVVLAYMGQRRNIDGTKTVKGGKR